MHMLEPVLQSWLLLLPTLDLVAQAKLLSGTTTCTNILQYKACGLVSWRTYAVIFCAVFDSLCCMMVARIAFLTSFVCSAEQACLVGLLIQLWLHVTCC
jgi:hypothetical protein